MRSPSAGRARLTPPVALSRLSGDAYTALGRVHPRVSRTGFGCYRVDDRVRAHRQALRDALVSGVNLIDTSTNYADGHSETLVGDVLAEAIAGGDVRREEVVVVTKAGYLQGGNLEEARRRARAGRPWTEIVPYGPDLWHSISPDFLADQITASLSRLGMARVDVLLLHNPEYALTDAAHHGVALDEARAGFYDRAERAFRHLESEIAAGRIGAYGVSSNTDGPTPSRSRTSSPGPGRASPSSSSPTIPSRPARASRSTRKARRASSTSPAAPASASS
jgi:aryl-alcohol dehydrogenase-like predicted oxidoreductase